MTRAEMVTKYNYYVRKRDSYIGKISTNSSVRSTLEACLTNCSGSMTKINAYADMSVLFETLATTNSTRFGTSEVTRILGMIDSVGTHLETEKSNAQKEINYWDGQIKAYDAEEARKKAEAEAAAAAAAAAQS